MISLPSLLRPLTATYAHSFPNNVAAVAERRRPSHRKANERKMHEDSYSLKSKSANIVYCVSRDRCPQRRNTHCGSPSAHSPVLMVHASSVPLIWIRREIPSPPCQMLSDSVCVYAVRGKCCCRNPPPQFLHFPTTCELTWTMSVFHGSSSHLRRTFPVEISVCECAIAKIIVAVSSSLRPMVSAYTHTRAHTVAKMHNQRTANKSRQQ